MLELLFSWNFKRLVRRPRHVVAVLAIALVLNWVGGILAFFPGAVGLVVLCGMAFGFIAPSAESVAAEARYVLTRSAGRVACLVTWTCFSITVMAGAALTVWLVWSRTWPIGQVMVFEQESQRLLGAAGFVSQAASPEHPEIRNFMLPGYSSFVGTLVVLGALMGLFSRLGEVGARALATRPLRLLSALLANAPPVLLLLVWMVLALGGHAGYVTVWSYLHPAWLVSTFALATAISTWLCWRAWTHGDIE